MTSILAASDATEHSDPVVAAALDLAEKIGAEVTVVHVLTEQRLADLRQSLGSEEAYTDAVMRLIADALGDQLTRVADGPDAATKLVLNGPVGMTILEHAASAEADFLALGLRNRSRVGKFLMGSDVQQILLSTPCPVLGVPV
ncbi:MAG TPA: universal stress protein [Acidimicrobiia bacterium]